MCGDKLGIRLFVIVVRIGRIVCWNHEPMTINMHQFKFMYGPFHKPK